MSRKRFTIWLAAFTGAVEGILLLLPGAHSASAQAQFKTTTQLVLTPVRVTDHLGKTVDGLKADDFELFENGKPRKFELESTFEPVSLVVAVQTSGISGPALAKIRKIGGLIQPLIVGDQGAGAVLTFSDQVRVRQDFTDDPAKIGAAFRAIEPDGSGAAMHQAIAEGVRMLAARETTRRRVLIVIGEARDRSSKIALEEVITRAQAANVVIYPVSYSATWTSFTSKGGEQFDSGKSVYPSGGGMDLIAVFREIARTGNQNGHQALAEYTGGMRSSFVKLKGLEEALQRAGEDLHSQYLLSFRASPIEDSHAYRWIQVRVRTCPDCAIRHRPGYWRDGD